MEGTTGNRAVLASPDDIGPGDRLTLYLYEVSENPELKNAERQEMALGQFREPPLSLDLYYLLTAHPTGGDDGDAMSQAEAQHRALGRAMHILRDNSILRGSDLEGPLAEEGLDLHISMYPHSTDEIVSIWSTFQDRPFQPSVSYLVSPVTIESTRTRETQRVVEKDRRLSTGVEETDE